MWKNDSVVGDCKCDQFSQVNVCTERDVDWVVSLQISCRPCLQPIEKKKDRQPSIIRNVPYAVMMLQCFNDYSPINAIVMLLYRRLQSTLGYDTVIRRMWVVAADRNFAFQVAAKPLQIKTWLILMSYRNSSSLCPTVSSPTSYDVRFSRNACVTDKQTINVKSVQEKNV